VNRHSGQIIWRLGGKRSSFTIKAAPGQVFDSAGQIFAWQHDPEAIGPGEYTVFDNESTGASLLPHSRVVTVRLNPLTHTATLVKSVDQPDGLVAPSQGNGQTTRNGDLFVGWGALPYFSEFSDRDGCSSTRDSRTASTPTVRTGCPGRSASTARAQPGVS